jgi:folylpolyglutamate synthase/dihydropteroate synthase
VCGRPLRLGRQGLERRDDRAGRSGSAAATYAREQGWNAVSEPDFEAALARATEMARTVVVTGSFHTVGDAMARLDVDPVAG